MTQNVDRETVVSRLLAADDILILCHKNPDGDTIGSGTALCLALQQLESSALKNESRQIQTACEGVKVLSLSLPCRYPYSISAMIQQEDLERTGCLLQALAAAIAG